MALYSDFVKEPEGEELIDIMELYRLLGLSGAIGSMDCTSVCYGRCPASLKWLYIGKDGYPTLSFQCVVDHNRKIHHVSEPFYGGTNDKTVTANDTFPCKVAAGYDAYGVPKLCKGAYLIVDGGYEKLGYLICPRPYPSTIQDVEWSEWLERVRKDVECTFGILKARWR